MEIVQTFYNDLAAHYDKLFADWQAATREQAGLLDGLLQDCGVGKNATVLDCACGIGTQAIGLAALGYAVTGSDNSVGALEEAGKRAARAGVTLPLVSADFCRLSAAFAEPFDVILCMDNALPHMLTPEALEAAVVSITGQLTPGGLFVASIRDYDALLATKPPYSPPYIHPTETGRNLSFQTWDWQGENYTLTQYIIEDGNELQTRKFTCAYRATRRAELTDLLLSAGCTAVEWKFPEETGFYQPILIAKKQLVF